MKPKVLIYDLEVSPILGWVYGTYDTNVLKIEKTSHIMCFSYKWLGDKKVKNVAQSDFHNKFKKDPYDDYEVVKKLHELIEEADYTIGYNVKGFDDKVTNTRILFHGLDCPSPHKAIDPLTTSRSKFKFPNNKLQTVCQYLDIGSKTSVTHGDLWYDCIKGDKKSWKAMKKYCDQDVVLVEKVYLKLRPYMTNHPNMVTGTDNVNSCPRCNSTHLQSRGTRNTNSYVYRQYQCQNCRGYFSERLSDDGFIPSTYVNI